MKNKSDIKNGWSLETIYEIIGDLVCFEFILKIKINEEDYEFWESLFDFPRRTLAAFMTSLKININLCDVFEENSKLLNQNALKVESELLCSRYAYKCFV